MDERLEGEDDDDDIQIPRLIQRDPRMSVWAKEVCHPHSHAHSHYQKHFNLSKF